MIGILALLAGLAWAEPALELKPPATSVVIGTPVELEGTVSLPDGASLLFEPPAGSSGPVTVLGVKQDKGAVKVVVAAFELGLVSLPEKGWLALGADGAAQPVRLSPVRFESVGPPDVKPDQDIRDIRGPIGPALWPLLLLLAAAAAGAWWWWKNRKVEGPGGRPAPVVDHRLPHERALDELNALFQSEVPVKEFYIRLTDILRRYFQARFGVDAAVLTTGDLMRHLRESELDRPLLARCRDVFDHADLVKFAKWVPSTAEIRKDWTEAEGLVRQTAPKPPPVPENAGK
ncbi:MAG: hypothetical protein HY925_06145 [Elusimicrobia bacterium]|nr:hypothetical protein [Elusimicrobiota bacterium]